MLPVGWHNQVDGHRRAPAPPPPTRSSTRPPPLEDYNPFDADRPLVEALRREGAEWAEGRTRELGAICGSRQTIRWGVRGQRAQARAAHPRPLRQPHRRGRVRQLLARADADRGRQRPARRRPGANPAPAPTSPARRMFMLLMQAESGVGCPISMTYSAIPALRKQPELAEEWEPRFLSLDYDERSLPAERKRGSLCGMAMTEKQGGSDVRANTTTATPLNGGGPGAEYELVGHKWFCSAPMCDAFLVLAQTDVGHLLLPDAALDARRRAQRLPHPAPQGQARQPLQRLQRGRVPRRLGADGRRGGARRADDHRDGQPHPPRLRDRRRHRLPRRGRRRRSTTPPTAPPSARS